VNHVKRAAGCAAVAVLVAAIAVTATHQTSPGAAHLAWTPAATASTVTLTAPVTIVIPDTTTTAATTGTTTTSITTTTAPTTTTTTTTTASPLPAGSVYVAMGDSYSSGEGANQIPGGTPDSTMISGNCRRSTKAAQMLLTAQYGWQLTNPACAGSTTANVLNTFGWEAPQMTQLTANAKLVTMTIGGNDVQLLQLLVNCVVGTFYGDCVPTNNTGYAPTPAQQIATVDTAIAQLEPKIENVVRAVIGVAPGAKVRMAGYPWVIAPPGQPIGTCTWLSTGEQTMFDTELHKLNDAIRIGTQTVAAANPGLDIQYVDPMVPGSPFQVTDNGCSTTSTRYMNAATGDSTNWHPNIYGQQHYADLYRASLGL